MGILGMRQLTLLCTGFILLAISLAARSQSIPESAPLGAETMWKLQRVGAPSLSPDGKLAVVPVTRYDVEKNQGFTDLWLVPADRPGEARQLTSDAAADTEPRFSPDGQWVAFLSKRGDDKENQVYVIALAGGEARRVTNVPTGASAIKWFSDSKRIAFVSAVWTDLKTWDEMDKRLKERAESKVTAKTWDKPPFSYWDHFLEERLAHVYSISVSGGEPQAITVGTGLSLSTK
jgi:dipeptidyl aminopeptidase/acylaminoacyl peptidase